jgi:nuclear GTP-binding protein
VDTSFADTSVADTTAQDFDEEEFEGFGSDDGGVELNNVVADVDEAFGLDSEDEDSEIEDAEEDNDETEAAEQLQEELHDDADASIQEDRKPSRKKRQKT